MAHGISFDAGRSILLLNKFPTTGNKR